MTLTASQLYQQKWYQANKQKCLERARLYRQNNLEAVRSYDRKRGLSPARKAANKKRRLAAPKRFNESVKQAKAKKPDKYRDQILRQTQRRRTILRGVFKEDVSMNILFERDFGECGICLSPIDMTLFYPDSYSPSIDHVVPLMRGGEHSYANTQLAHLQCNLRKGAKV